MKLLKIFPLRRKGEDGVQKIAEKIRYLRRDAIVDDPYENFAQGQQQQIFYINITLLVKLKILKE